MLTRRAEFSYVVLAAIFLAMVILAWIFKEVTFVFLDNAPIILKVSEVNFPLYVGKLPFQIVLLALALLVLNLLNEFFGARSAFFISLASGGMLFLLWFFLNLLPWLPSVENSENINYAFRSTFSFNKRYLISMIVSLIVGFGFISYIFEIFRKMTHSSFSIIRLFMAHIIGLGVFLAIFVFLNSPPETSFGSMLALFVTRFIQWFFLFILFVPFYYIIKFSFKIIIGDEHYGGVADRFAKKSLFKHEEKDFFESRKETQEKRIS